MRALCGAIIAAGALLGLGLTAQGIATRYAQQPAYYTELESTYSQDDPKLGESKQPIKRPARVLFTDMDRPLIFILVFLTSMSIVGLSIAFLGIVYHHMRRDRDYLWEKERFAAQQQRTTV